MKDQAKFQEEMEKRKNTEEQLRAEASMTQGPPVAEGDLGEQLDRLQKIELRQRQEIDRYMYMYMHVDVDVHACTRRCRRTCTSTCMCVHCICT